ncbi:MAG: hypothetical protein AAGD00_06070, partial [Planctomycetota bacterium]
MSDEAKQAKPTRPERMFCSECAFDLVGVPALGRREDASDTLSHRCPECGTPFDPGDAATFRTSAVTRNARRRRRSAWIVLLLLGTTALIVWGVIPRPAMSRSFSSPVGFTANAKLWVWLGRPFGIEESGYRTQNALGQMRVAWWFGVPRSFLATERGTEQELWSIERHRGDRWTMRVHDVGTPWQVLVRSFNSTRRDDEIFGVALVDAQGRSRGHQPTPTPADRPFEVTGDQVDVLSQLIIRYGLTTDPMARLGDGSTSQSHAWVFDEQAQRLKFVRLEDLAQYGEELIVYPTNLRLGPMPLSEA